MTAGKQPATGIHLIVLSYFTGLKKLNMDTDKVKLDGERGRKPGSVPAFFP